MNDAQPSPSAESEDPDSRRSPPFIDKRCAILEEESEGSGLFAGSILREAALPRYEIAETLHPPTFLRAGPEARREAAEQMARTTVEMHVEPQRVIGWETACEEARAMREADKDSPVLVVCYNDGICDAPSQVRYEPDPASVGDDYEGPFLVVMNLDHHNVHDKPGTRSTAIQVRDAILARRFTHPKAAGKPVRLAMKYNDPDQDNATTHGLVENAYALLGYDEERLSEIDAFLDLQDDLDCRGGLKRLDPAEPLVRKMAAIFQPYMHARRANSFLLKTEPGCPASQAELERAQAEIASVIRECADHFKRFCERPEAAPETDLDTNARWLYPAHPFRGMAWGMIDEANSGDYAKVDACNKLLRGLITCRVVPGRDGQPDRYVYSLFKIGFDVVRRGEQSLDFPLEQFFAFMNDNDPGVEAAMEEAAQEALEEAAKKHLTDTEAIELVRRRIAEAPRWGGNEWRGGGPRPGTGISPGQLVRRFRQFLGTDRPPTRGDVRRRQAA